MANQWIGKSEAAARLGIRPYQVDALIRGGWLTLRPLPRLDRVARIDPAQIEDVKRRLEAGERPRNPDTGRPAIQRRTPGFQGPGSQTFQ